VKPQDIVEQANIVASHALAALIAATPPDRAVLDRALVLAGKNVGDTDSEEGRQRLLATLLIQCVRDRLPPYGRTID
jgi:hypothetical protein